MAVVEEIRIEGDTSGFQKQIDALNKKIEELEKNLGGVQKEAADVGKEAKKTGGIINKAFDGLKKVVTAPFELAKRAASGLGNLLKGGLGIGLVVGVVDKLSESFQSNQKVVDAVNKVMTTLSIIFSQITEAIFGAVEEQSKLNGGFDATKKVLGGLISGVLNVFVVNVADKPDPRAMLRRQPQRRGIHCHQQGQICAFSRIILNFIYVHRQ